MTNRTTTYIILIYSTLAMGCKSWIQPFSPSCSFSAFKVGRFPMPNLNSTMGHPDAMLGLGLNPDTNGFDNLKMKNQTLEFPSWEDEEEEEEEELEDESKSIIPLDEIKTALSGALRIADLTDQQIQSEGWSVVHNNELFSLYKRRANNGLGAVEYLMMGTFDDVSPGTFLHSQIDKETRSLWDTTMKEMSEGEIILKETPKWFQQCLGDLDKQIFQDILYYRTKWPWPLKDRDYTLARRCKVFDQENAIVFVSKSTECDTFPAVDGVIRVDNYWCHSVFMSKQGPKTPVNSIKTPESLNIEKPTMEKPIEISPEPKIEPKIEKSSHSPTVNHHKLPYEFKDLFDRKHIKHKLKAQMLDDFKKKESNNRMFQRSGGSRFEFFNVFNSNSKSENTENKPKPLDNSEEKPPVLETSSKIEEPKIRNPSSSSRKKKIKADIASPGMRFVTIFCDDQKVPLPPRVVDILSKQGEKVVPGSVSRLHDVSKDLQLKYPKP